MEPAQQHQSQQSQQSQSHFNISVDRIKYEDQLINSTINMLKSTYQMLKSSYQFSISQQNKHHNKNNHKLRNKQAKNKQSANSFNKKKITNRQVHKTEENKNQYQQNQDQQQQIQQKQQAKSYKADKGQNYRNQGQRHSHERILKIKQIIFQAIQKIEKSAHHQYNQNQIFQDQLSKNQHLQYDQDQKQQQKQQHNHTQINNSSQIKIACSFSNTVDHFTTVKYQQTSYLNLNASKDEIISQSKQLNTYEIKTASQIKQSQQQDYLDSFQSQINRLSNIGIQGLDPESSDFSQIQNVYVRSRQLSLESAWNELTKRQPQQFFRKSKQLGFKYNQKELYYPINEQKYKEYITQATQHLELTYQQLQNMLSHYKQNSFVLNILSSFLTSNFQNLQSTFFRYRWEDVALIQINSKQFGDYYWKEFIANITAFKNLQFLLIKQCNIKEILQSQLTTLIDTNNTKIQYIYISLAMIKEKDKSKHQILNFCKKNNVMIKSQSQWKMKINQNNKISQDQILKIKYIYLGGYFNDPMNYLKDQLKWSKKDFQQNFNKELNKNNLRNLSLSGFRGYNLKMDVLTQFNWNQIFKINLWNCNINDKVWIIFVSNSNKFSNLQTIELASNKITTVLQNDLDSFQSLDYIEFTFTDGSGPNPLSQESKSILKKYNQKHQLKKRAIYLSKQQKKASSSQTTIIEQQHQ